MTDKTLPDDVQDAIQWLSEYRGEDAEQCKLLLERQQQRIDELEKENSKLLDDVLKFQRIANAKKNYRYAYDFWLRTLSSASLPEPETARETVAASKARPNS